MQKRFVPPSVERGGGEGREERWWWGLERQGMGGKGREGGKREIFLHKDLKEEGIEKVTSEGAEFSLTGWPGRLLRGGDIYAKI